MGVPVDQVIHRLVQTILTGLLTSDRHGWLANAGQPDDHLAVGGTGQPDHTGDATRIRGSE
jgi:hypothetical protein